MEAWVDKQQSINTVETHRHTQYCYDGPLKHIHNGRLNHKVRKSQETAHLNGNYNSHVEILDLRASTTSFQSVNSDLNKSITSLKPDVGGKKGIHWIQDNLRDTVKSEIDFSRSLNSSVGWRRCSSAYKVKAEYSPLLNSRELLDSQTPDTWKDLQYHILSINERVIPQPQVLSDKTGSDIYKKLIDDERKRRKARREGLKKAINMTKNFNKLTLLAHNEAGNDTESDEDNNPDVKYKSRGWVVLRRYLQEKRLEKKLKESSGGWNLISKTVHHMTDVEKSRQDLYERYLDKPNEWRQGLLNYKTYEHIFDHNWKQKQSSMSKKTSKYFNDRKFSIGGRSNRCVSLYYMSKDDKRLTPNKRYKKRPYTAYATM